MNTIRLLALILGLAYLVNAQISGGGKSGGAGGSSGSVSVVSTTYTTAVYVPSAGGGVTPNATESAVATYEPIAGSIMRFAVSVGTAPGGSASLTFTWRKDASSQPITCTITGSARNCIDATHTFPVAQGSLTDIQIVGTGSPAATTVTMKWGTPGLAGPSGPQGLQGPSGSAGSQGPAGPAPAGTGFVLVSGGALGTPRGLQSTDLPLPGASAPGAVKTVDCTGIGHMQKLDTTGTFTCAADSGGGSGGATWDSISATWSTI